MQMTTQSLSKEPISLKEITPLEEQTATQEALRLTQYLLVFWRGKYIIALFVILGIGIATAWLKNVEPSYTARMTFVPVRFSQTTSLVGGLSQNLPARFGAVLGQAANAGVLDFEFEQFIEMMTMPVLAERLEKRHNIMTFVFKKYWDATNQRWARPDNPIANFEYGLREFFGMPIWSEPTINDLAKYLGEKLKIQTRGKIGTREISFEHPDREFALNILRWLYANTETLFRAAAGNRVVMQINFLRAKLKEQQVAEHRQVLINLLGEQERRMMLIQPSVPYVVELMQPPVASDMPTSPRLMLTMLLGIGLGLATGIFVVVARNLYQARLI